MGSCSTKTEVADEDSINTEHEIRRGGGTCSEDMVLAQTIHSEGGGKTTGFPVHDKHGIRVK